MTFRTKLFSLACLLTLSQFVAAAPSPAPVPTPDEEKAQFDLAPGFEINLFAADPLIDKPIQMNFDPSGRLWVASSESYPQIKPGSKANDKVLVMSDDGTGHARDVRVFADGLLIPTSVAYGHGGVYVANSTELLHFDEGPDGKATNKRIVLSGFGTEDTHHILHTLRWGPDGRLYFNQSVYIHSHIETPWGPRTLNSGGIWRFEPQSMKLEVFIKGLWNTWGHAFDDYGQSLGTDGAGTEGVNYNVPGAMYPAYAGADRILHGLNPGSPKYAGCEIVGGSALPDDWQGLLLTNDFRASRVCRFELSDDGSGFAAKQLSDVVKSKTNVFRPVDIKMGPDGAIYIADWCNPIINHGEVDFRDPRRDHSHGRIWRLTYKDKKTLTPPKLVDAPLDQLFDLLRSSEPYTRQQAKRVLAERKPAEVVAAGEQFLQAYSERNEHHALEVLWVYESVDHVDVKLLKRLLACEDDGRIRAAAVRVLSHWHDQIKDGPQLLAKAISDPFPRVRLEAIRALACYPSAQSEALALKALDQPRDRFIDYALYLTSVDLKDQWQPAVDKGELKLPPTYLAYALQSIGSKAALQPMLAELKSGKMTDDDKASLMNLVATSATPEDMGMAFDLAADRTLPCPMRVELLAAVTKAATAAVAAGQKPPADAAARLKELFQDDPAVRVAAIELAGAAKIEALRGDLVSAATAKGATAADRQAAIAALGRLGGKASVESLTKLSDAGHPQPVRFMAAAALVPIDVKAAAHAAAEALAGDKLEGNPTPLFNAFLQRKNGDKALADALADKHIAPDAAKLGLRAISQTSRTDSPLLAALTTAGNIDATPKELTKEQMAALVSEVAAKGDAARGEQIFRRKELNCLGCHAVAGTGGIVAPDLLSLGASAPVDYIVDSILLPNKAVKEGYNSIIVATKDGDQITGIRVRQNDKELVLKDATRDEIVIPLSQIKSSRDGGSIMPAGLADAITHQEFVDLVRFLSELGKGQYAAAGMPVARRWQVVDPPLPSASSMTPQMLDATAGVTWRTEYAEVNGVLPLSAFGKGRAIARTQLNVSTPGKIAVKLNDPAGILTAYFDNKLVDPKAPIEVDAAQGTHSLMFVLDFWTRKDGLHAELVDVPGSAAKSQFVGGK